MHQPTWLRSMEQSRKKNCCHAVLWLADVIGQWKGSPFQSPHGNDGCHHQCAPLTNLIHYSKFLFTYKTHTLFSYTLLPFFSTFLYTINKMFCRSLLTITTLVALHTSSAAAATVAAAASAGPSGCVSFDAFWNLYAFGFNGKDYNAGTQDTWSSSSGRKNGFPGHHLVVSTCWCSINLYSNGDGHYY